MLDCSWVHENRTVLDKNLRQRQKETESQRATHRETERPSETETEGSERAESSQPLIHRAGRLPLSGCAWTTVWPLATPLVASWNHTPLWLVPFGRSDRHTGRPRGPGLAASSPLGSLTSYLRQLFAQRPSCQGCLLWIRPPPILVSSLLVPMVLPSGDTPKYAWFILMTVSPPRMSASGTWVSPCGLLQYPQCLEQGQVRSRCSRVSVEGRGEE